MKKFVALLGVLAGVALLTAQTPPAPAAPAKPVVKEEPPIPGIVIQRPGGNQLGLTITNGSFKLSFYDKKRKAIPADVTRAMARWHPTYKAIPEQTVMNLMDDGKALGGGIPVRPPYTFKLFLTLLKGDGDDEHSVESYTVGVSDAILPKS